MKSVYYGLMFLARLGLLSLACAPVASVPSDPEPGTLSSGPIHGMTFAWIPSGSFSMGSPFSEQGRQEDEGPLHTVKIQGFEMMTTEVTQGMWKGVMGDNPAHDYGVGSSHPVYYVSWNDCLAFIEQLNLLDPTYEYRLPSEAEWEYACRAVSKTAFYWGNTMDGSYCWYSDNSNGATHRVGQTLPNAWGLYDMSGNVWEWCEDWYHQSYSGAPTDGTAWIAPDGSLRVIRAGGWYVDAQYCRSADRCYGSPDFSFVSFGLRLARSAR